MSKTPTPAMGVSSRSNASTHGASSQLRSTEYSASWCIHLNTFQEQSAAFSRLQSPAHKAMLAVQAGQFVAVCFRESTSGGDIRGAFPDATRIVSVESDYVEKLARASPSKSWRAVPEHSQGPAPSDADVPPDDDEYGGDPFLDDVQPSTEPPPAWPADPSDSDIPDDLDDWDASLPYTEPLDDPTPAPTPAQPQRAKNNEKKRPRRLISGSINTDGSLSMAEVHEAATEHRQKKQAAKNEARAKGGRVSLFPSHNAHIPGVEVWLADLHAWQCGGPMPPEAEASPLFSRTPRDLAQHIAASMAKAKDKAAVTAVKSGLPGWSPAGLCSEHRASADVTAATGYVQLDFDRVGDEAEELLSELFAMPFCVQAGISTSGGGVFAIVKLGIIPQSKDEYTRHLAALVAIVQEALGASWTDLFDPQAKKEGRPHYDPSPARDWSYLRYVTDGRGERLLYRADAEKASTDVWLAERAREEAAATTQPPQQGPDPTRPAKGRQGDDYPDLTRDDVAEMLSYLHPDKTPAGYSNADYSWWLAVGMAVHDFDVGYLDLWLTFSAKSSEWNQEECLNKWPTFGSYSGKKITIGTVIHFGEEAGYIPPWKRGKRPATTAATATPTLPAEEEEHEEQAKPPEFPCPGGPVKYFVEYITTMHGSHPLHAAGGVFAMLAAAIQHHVDIIIGGNRIPTNLYFLGLGRSSTRKTSGLRATKGLFSDAGWGEWLLPTDVTGEGLRDHLMEQAQGGADGDDATFSQPAGGFLVVDEGALMLFSDKISHFKSLRSILLLCADGEGIDARRAQWGRKKASHVRLSLLTATTPTAFFDNCDASVWGDGLMTRICPGYVDNRTDPWTPQRLPEQNETTAAWRAELVAILNKIRTELPNHPRNWAIDAFYFDWNEERFLQIDRDEKAGNIEPFEAMCSIRCIGRAAVFALILAVVDAAEGKGEWGVVTQAHVEKGIALAEYYLALQVFLHGLWLQSQVGRGRMQQLLNYVWGCQEKTGKTAITKRKLRASCRRQFSDMEIDAILAELYKINAIHMEEGARGSVKIKPTIKDLGIK